MTRRQLLAGAGAITASLGAVDLLSSAAFAKNRWDYEADIVVVGSGVGGCTAALIAHKLGASTIVVEKAPYVGGTSLKSAGVLWIPNNFVLKAKGVKDGKQDCLQYMARYSYPERYTPDRPHLGLHPEEFRLLEAFYDNSSKAIDALREMKALTVAEWCGFKGDTPAVDYLDHIPENKVPIGRALGPVRPDGDVGLGADLMSQLEAALRKRNVPILLEHRAVRLVMNDGRRVVGLEAESAGGVVSLRARKGVIFASGGYVHNPALVDTYQSQRLYGSCAMPSATGDFISIAGAAGARVAHMSGAWRTQIVFDEALNSRLLGQGVFFPPGDSMLQVNKYGKRAVNEKRNYNDRAQAHGVFDSSNAEYPNQLLFMIYDQRTAEAFAGAFPLPADPNGASHVLRAHTIEALTDRLSARLKEVAAHTGGLSLGPSFAANLTATIARFNEFARTGNDEEFGRGAAEYDRMWHKVFSPMKADAPWPPNGGPNPTMHPLSKSGPYFAILLASGALDTNGGPVIDARARVLNEKDEPIGGLYGAGNCIASPSRFAYWGAGHTLAQSMTFGYIAANSAYSEHETQT
jgi:succinate dehydrogenase/fumarate reductase flavoprotein subunit